MGHSLGRNAFLFSNFPSEAPLTTRKSNRGQYEFTVYLPYSECEYPDPQQMGSKSFYMILLKSSEQNFAI